MHRDSLGYAQAIEPGAVNLMVAGRGIVHSERAGDDLNRHSRLHGIQSWLALPDAELECEPSFTHFAEAQIPAITRNGAGIRLIIGEAFGQCSPVASFVDTLYLDVTMHAGTSLSMPVAVPEAGVYVVEGEACINEHDLAAGQLAVLAPGAAIDIEARSSTRFMVIGGEPVGSRILWWNFVAPSQGRIDQAKADWRAGRFEGIVGDDEFIPLPEQ
jgi:redox-sensitive bicupin YhaK (pirin superfamily)